MSTRHDSTSHPPLAFEAYRSNVLRAPRQAPVTPPSAISEIPLPLLGSSKALDLGNDLTKNARRNGEPLGERIIVAGKVIDEAGAPLPGVTVEIWQANAAGRYIQRNDQHDAPLDPNFDGVGRVVTGVDGSYSFITIKPGAYPWKNHPNAWRPSHIHFSLTGATATARLVTQMYFPGDPLLGFDPILGSVPEPSRELLLARFDLELTRPGYALGYAFDIVLPAAGSAER
jgi:protocatechuate 3,4-dioxygenase beta subunit